MIPLACPKSSGDSCCILGRRRERELLLTLWILRDLQETRTRRERELLLSLGTSYVVVLELIMKRRTKPGYSGAGRRIANQKRETAKLPGQAGKCLCSRHLRHLSANSPCLVTHEKAKLFGGRAENFYRTSHAIRSCGEGGVSGYHSTYMYPHCMSRSAWAHSHSHMGEETW